jgi:exosome complex component CSL4
MSLFSTANKIALPGEILRHGSAEIEGDWQAGPGTYVGNEGELRSSQSGFVVQDGETVSVVPPMRSAGAGGDTATLKRDCAILVGDVVHGRVTKLMANQAVLEVLVVNSVELRIKGKGVIRREDVRATETDQLRLQDCFRPGDIVRAKVTSLGDKNQLSLSTAEDSFGVRFAKNSTTGSALTAVSATQMKDSGTADLVSRKVACAEETPASE